MSSEIHHAHSIFESQIAEKYRQEGFEIIIEPKIKDLPFDIGTYRPDIIAKKSADEGYIIEVKVSATNTSVDRYREIADTVSQHPGWRFLLITGDDVPLDSQDKDDNLLTWHQMIQRQSQAERLIILEEMEGAFLSLWAVLEAALRRHAKQVSIPVERFPTSSLIKHLYSQGELSMEQFDAATALQSIRNRFVHGYQTLDLDISTKQLKRLVDELLLLWSPK